MLHSGYATYLGRQLRGCWIGHRVVRPSRKTRMYPAEPPVWSMLLLLNVSLLRARPSLLTSASCHELPRCRLMVDRKIRGYPVVSRAGFAKVAAPTWVLPVSSGHARR